MQVSPFPYENILSYGLAAAAAVATYVNLRLKADVQAIKNEFDKSNSALENRIADRLDRFRSEFTKDFVPERIASEQRSSLIDRIGKLETKTETQSSRIHELSNQIMNKVVGEIFQINSTITDKARRIAAMEVKQDTADRIQHDHGDRMHDLEARLRALENGKD